MNETNIEITLKLNHYIYLLKEREFIKTNENIYKIGKTTQNNGRRFGKYPKGSRLLIQLACDDCHKMEKKLLIIFNTKYKLRNDIGREYFEGNCRNMIEDIYNTIMENNNSITNESNSNDLSELKIINNNIGISQNFITFINFLSQQTYTFCNFLTKDKSIKQELRENPLSDLFELFEEFDGNITDCIPNWELLQIYYTKFDKKFTQKQFDIFAKQIFINNINVDRTIKGKRTRLLYKYKLKIPQ